MPPGSRRSTIQVGAHIECGFVPHSGTRSTNALSSVASTPSRKGRGKAINKALTDHIEATGLKPKIDIQVGKARPVGKWGKEFVSEVGIICRTYAPITCRNWKSVDKKQIKVFHARIKKLSEKNSMNMQNLKVNHCAGSKSFVRYREELRDAETLEELGRIEFYRRTHYKEGKWTSPIAEQNYVAMIKLKNQLVPEGSDPLTEDEICDQVLGIRPGYIQGLGHGNVPLPSSPPHDCNHDEVDTNAEVAELTKRAELAEKCNEELTERIQTQERKMEEMQTIIAKWEAFIMSKYNVDSSPRSDFKRHDE